MEPSPEGTRWKRGAARSFGGPRVRLSPPRVRVPTPRHALPYEHAALGVALLLGVAASQASLLPGWAQCALMLTLGDDPYRCTLAVAYAAAGRLDEAAATAAQALEVARASGQDELARDLSERLASYRAGRSAQ